MFSWANSCICVKSYSGMSIVPEVCKLSMREASTVMVTDEMQQSDSAVSGGQPVYVTSLVDPNLIYVQKQASKKE